MTKLLQIKDIRDRYNRSDRTIRRWVEMGILPAIKFGGTIIDVGHHKVDRGPLYFSEELLATFEQAHTINIPRPPKRRMGRTADQIHPNKEAR